MLILEDGEIYLPASSFLLVPSTLSGMSVSIWPVRPRQHQRSHQQWTPVALEPMVWGRWRNQGDWGLWSLWCLLCSWPLKGWQGDGGQSKPPSPDASFGGELLRGSNWKGCWASRFTWGHPSPLALTQQSVMAWAMALLPLELSLGLWWGRPIFQPTCLLLWVGMQHL